MTIHERYLHTLAERLSMTVSRLRAEMSLREYLSWIAFDHDRVERRNRKPGQIDLDDADDAVVLRGFGL